MAKLHFRYGAMNCGKSTALLQVAHNYEERGMHVLLVKPRIDNKGKDQILSRLGASRSVDLLADEALDLYAYIKQWSNDVEQLSCVLVDEAQFLDPAQIDQLFKVVIELNIPVLCYGLRTDFRTQLFPAAQRLFALAHSAEELKTICRCGKKALFTARSADGVFVFDGDQIAIDGQDVQYESLCGTCYSNAYRSSAIFAKAKA